MTDELRKEPDDGGTRGKGLRRPRRDTTKRARSTKEKSDMSDTAASEKAQTEQTGGSALASTTTDRPIVQTSSPAEPKRSPVKSGAGSQAGKGKSAGASRQEPSVSPSQNHERIARRAYALYEASGYRGEDALQHWLEAERELRNHKDDRGHEN